MVRTGKNRGSGSCRRAASGPPGRCPPSRAAAFRLRTTQRRHDNLLSSSCRVNLWQSSYELQAVVEPNWHAILAKLAEEEGVAGDELLEKCRSKDGSLNPAGWGLWHRSFRFVVFHDEFSDLEQIWSDHHRTFVEQAVVEGHIFEEAAFRSDQAFKGSVSRRFIASPSQLGFASAWDPGGDIESESDIGESLGTIPVDQIVSFLIELDAHGAAMHAIKTFPESLVKAFADNGVTYSSKHLSLQHLGAEFEAEVLHFGGREAETSRTPQTPEMYSQTVVFHGFETTFFTLRLRLKTYDARVTANNHLQPSVAGTGTSRRD